jgi:hypothetical protein
MICHFFKICDILYVIPNYGFLLLVNPDASKYFNISKLLKFESFESHWDWSRILLIENDLKAPSPIINLHYDSHLLIKLADDSSDDDNFSDTLTVLKL